MRSSRAVVTNVESIRLIACKSEFILTKKSPSASQTGSFFFVLLHSQHRMKNSIQVMMVTAVRIKVNTPNITRNMNDKISPIVKKIPKINNIIAIYFSAKIELFLEKSRIIETD